MVILILVIIKHVDILFKVQKIQMLSSKCALCSSKKQQAKRLLSNLVLKTPLNNIPVLGDVLF